MNCPTLLALNVCDEVDTTPILPHKQMLIQFPILLK
jgi:hypothetical protein